jgi:hypothetical protein
MIAPYRELLMQAVYERRTLGSLWVTWCLLALAVMVTIGAGFWLRHWQAGVLMGDVMLGVTAALWWGRMVNVAIMQNLPSHACLVPQLRRRLMRMVALTFVASVLVVTGIAASVIGHFGYLLCGLSLLFPFVLLQQRYPLLALLPSVIIFSMLSWLKAPWQALVRIASGYDEAVVSVLLLCAIVELSVWSLRVAFPRGGDAHADWRVRYVQRQLRMKGDQRGNSFLDRGLVRRWPALRNFWRTLGLRVGQGRSTTATAGNNMQYALGISVYGAAVSVPVMALFGWFCCVFPAMFSDQFSMAWSFWKYMVELMVTLAVPSVLQSMVTAISQRTGEQGLLRLAPGMPAAPAINAMLSRVLAQGFALVWGTSMVCELLVQRLSAGHWVLDGAVALLLVLPLPFFAMVLRDFAAMPVRHTPQIGIVFLSLPVLALAWLLRWYYAPLCGWVALLLVVASVAVLRQRWQDMLRAPVAFPAGRLAA